MSNSRTVYTELGDNAHGLPDGAITISADKDDTLGKYGKYPEPFPVTEADLDIAIEQECAQRNTCVQWRDPVSYTRSLCEVFKGKLGYRYQRYTYLVLKPRQLPRDPRMTEPHAVIYSSECPDCGAKIAYKIVTIPKLATGEHFPQFAVCESCGVKHDLRGSPAMEDV
jgi:hypothetical protein